MAHIRNKTVKQSRMEVEIKDALEVSGIEFRGTNDLYRELGSYLTNANRDMAQFLTVWELYSMRNGINKLDVFALRKFTAANKPKFSNAKSFTSKRVSTPSPDSTTQAISENLLRSAPKKRELELKPRPVALRRKITKKEDFGKILSSVNSDIFDKIPEMDMESHAVHVDISQSNSARRQLYGGKKQEGFPKAVIDSLKEAEKHLSKKFKIETFDSFTGVDQGTKNLIGIICAYDEEACTLSKERLSIDNCHLYNPSQSKKYLKLKFDSFATNLSLFPGQIVALKGSTPNGNYVIIKEIMSLEEKEVAKGESGSRFMDLLLCSGPFTHLEDLDYGHWEKVLSLCKNEEPDLLIVFGPFVDSSNKVVKTGKIEVGDCEITMEQLFEVFIHRLCTLCKDQPSLKVVLIPSPEDACLLPVFPQTTLDLPSNMWEHIRKENLEQNFIVVSNPSQLILDGKVRVGLNSSSIVTDLMMSRLEVNKSKGKVSSLDASLNFLTRQTLLYPMFPTRATVDFAALEKVDKRIMSSDVFLTTTKTTSFLHVCQPHSHMQVVAGIAACAKRFGVGKAVKMRICYSKHNQKVDVGTKIISLGAKILKSLFLEFDKVLYQSLKRLSEPVVKQNAKKNYPKHFTQKRIEMIENFMEYKKRSAQVKSNINVDLKLKQAAQLCLYLETVNLMKPDYLLHDKDLSQFELSGAKDCYLELFLLVLQNKLKVVGNNLRAGLTPHVSSENPTDAIEQNLGHILSCTNDAVEILADFFEHESFELDFFVFMKSRESKTMLLKSSNLVFSQIKAEMVKITKQFANVNTTNLFHSSLILEFFVEQHQIFSFIKSTFQGVDESKIFLFQFFHEIESEYFTLEVSWLKSSIEKALNQDLCFENKVHNAVENFCFVLKTCFLRTVNTGNKFATDSIINFFLEYEEAFASFLKRLLKSPGNPFFNQNVDSSIGEEDDNHEALFQGDDELTESSPAKKTHEKKLKVSLLHAINSLHMAVQYLNELESLMKSTYSSVFKNSTENPYLETMNERIKPIFTLYEKAVDEVVTFTIIPSIGDKFPGFLRYLSSHYSASNPEDEDVNNESYLSVFVNYYILKNPALLFCSQHLLGECFKTLIEDLAAFVCTKMEAEIIGNPQLKFTEVGALIFENDVSFIKQKFLSIYSIYQTEDEDENNSKLITTFQRLEHVVLLLQTTLGSEEEKSVHEVVRHTLTEEEKNFVLFKKQY
eukprot:augustus_masked-scaffold_15-processed-gene-9.45-mRNA-1 protein AED:1.00 eAED:1.00 QI:0/0/0/0/1/1/2/0/1216